MMQFWQGVGIAKFLRGLGLVQFWQGFGLRMLREKVGLVHMYYRKKQYKCTKNTREKAQNLVIPRDLKDLASKYI